MAQPLPRIEPGARAVIAGRTGSGKTTLARWLALRTPQRWVVFNPKHTAGFNTLRGAVTLQNFDDRKIDREILRNRFIIVNFSPAQNNNVFMDDALLYLHEAYANIGILIDELYTLHNHGRQGEGLTAVLTRGRERKQTFLGLTQRPAWVSLFTFSEADYMGCMSLNRIKDRHTMAENTGRDEFLKRLEPHDWLWYKVATDSLGTWGPVPTT